MQLELHHAVFTVVSKFATKVRLFDEPTKHTCLNFLKEHLGAAGLTGLTVNSCFFLPPPCVPYYIKYIYTYFYICMGGGVCIFGVLTVNLLTLPG